MPTPEEWESIARKVTDALPPLSDRQRRGLTAVARGHSRRKRNEAMPIRIEEGVRSRESP
jgi:hypothetical protein